ncbi:MAG TPA: hypothetical protein PKJ99_10605, partial [Thermoanaerobaculales bacterium]|nr:hypothetical protein [Thermoanaerobaculales bacterium]
YFRTCGRRGGVRCLAPFVRSPVSRACLVFCIGAAVELSQYLDVPVFGRTFDPLDLLMYAVGAAAAVGFDKLAFSPISQRPGA